MTIDAAGHEAIVSWIARIGAAGAQEIAARFDVSPAAARARLAACERRGLLDSRRLLHRQPALYVATRDGLRAVGQGRLEPCRVSPGGFAHLREVARVAVALERALPAVAVVGERELRSWERDLGRPLASAELGLALDGAYARHRPDLVLWPQARAGEPGAPAVAIEVELSVKAAPRLRAIVRGWARSRLVTGVVYYASAAVIPAVRAAVAQEQAGGAVHLLELERAGDLPAALGWPARSTSSNPSRA